MKRYAIISLFFICCLQAVVAQNTIEGIRKAYQEQKERIAEMNDEFPVEGYPPVYYHLHVAQNLPGTGPHHEDVYMYYGEQDMEDSSNPYPPHFLTFVTSKYNFAARKFYEEYLYDEKGNVVFIYARTPDMDFPKMHEFRFYFDGKRLLQFNVKVAEGLTSFSDEDIAAASFKEEYAGTDIPKRYAQFCSQYTVRANSFLKEFKVIDDNTYL